MGSLCPAALSARLTSDRDPYVPGWLDWAQDRSRAAMANTYLNSRCRLRSYMRHFHAALCSLQEAGEYFCDTEAVPAYCRSGNCMDLDGSRHATVRCSDLR